MYQYDPNTHLIPEKGMLLLAEPHLMDPYFQRSVILLCEHNDEGSFGFVLNNYIDFDMEQIGHELPFIDSRVSIGGPVRKSNLFYIHTAGEMLEDSAEVLPGIYMGGHFDGVKDLLLRGKISPQDIRFFVGYAGWSPNQLNEEMEQNSWIVANPYNLKLMDTYQDDLWSLVLKAMGPYYARLTTLPKDPRMN